MPSRAPSRAAGRRVAPNGPGASALMHLVCLVCLESSVSSFTLHPSNTCRSPLQWAALLFHRALWHDVDAKLMYSPLQVRCCQLVLTITPSYLWGECMVWTVRTVWCLWSDHPPILSSRFCDLAEQRRGEGQHARGHLQALHAGGEGSWGWDRSSCIAVHLLFSLNLMHLEPPVRLVFPKSLLTLLHLAAGHARAGYLPGPGAHRGGVDDAGLPAVPGAGRRGPAGGHGGGCGGGQGGGGQGASGWSGVSGPSGRPGVCRALSASWAVHVCTRGAAFSRPSNPCHCNSRSWRSARQSASAGGRRRAWARTRWPSWAPAWTCWLRGPRPGLWEGRRPFLGPCWPADVPCPFTVCSTAL